MQQWKFREELDPNQGRKMGPAAYTALPYSGRGERLESWQLFLPSSVTNSCSGSEPREPPPPLPLLPSTFLTQAGFQDLFQDCFHVS